MKIGRTIFKKSIGFLLIVALLAGLFVGMPHSGGVAYAEEKENLSVTAFATKEQLMNDFEPKKYVQTIGKIAFGKNSDGNTQEWYILGKDKGVEGDNIAIFADGAIKESVQT